MASAAPVAAKSFPAVLTPPSPAMGSPAADRLAPDQRAQAATERAATRTADGPARRLVTHARQAAARRSTAQGCRL